MNPNLVKQYRARLYLPNHLTCTMEGGDLGILKESVQRQLDGGTRFETAGSGSILIFHHSVDEGKTAIGWLTPFEVPEAMSIRAHAEIREQKLAA